MPSGLTRGIVDVFDKHGVSFVSVTQAFNTTTSMGRLTLNVLLSFAQFEREVTGERIRDKIAASKKKGMWMGGFVPFGYRPSDRTLVIEEHEAEIVRLIFALYLELGTVRQVETALENRMIAMPGRATKAGRIYGAKCFSRGQLYKMLSNPIYCGEISHKGVRYPGQHAAIIASEVFAQAADRLTSNSHERKTGRNVASPSLLAGLIVDADGNKLIATHATKQGNRYRYYISKALHDGRMRGRLGRDRLMTLEAEGREVWRLPAPEIEAVVVREIRQLLLDEIRLTEMVTTIEPDRPWPVSDRSKFSRTAKATAAVLAGHDPVASRTLILRLIARIEVARDTISIALNSSGLMAVLGFQMANTPTPHVDEPKLTIPVTLHRRGVETKLVLMNGGIPQSEPDQTLIRALARARRWMGDLIAGVHPSVVKLAEAYRTDARYVARHLPLACLSPKIIDQIVSGRQPIELTAWDLLNRIDIPLDWSDQKRRLGCG